MPGSFMSSEPAPGEEGMEEKAGPGGGWRRKGKGRGGEGERREQQWETRENPAS